MEFSLDRLYRINRRVILWLVFFGLLYLLRDFFSLILLTFIISFFAYPASHFLIERLRIHRVVAISAVYLAIVATYVSLVWWVAPNLVSEIGEVRKNIPQIGQKVIDLRGELIKRYPGFSEIFDAYLADEKIEHTITKYNDKIIAYLPQAVSTVFTLGITFLLAILFSFLISIDFSRLALEVRRLKVSRLHDFYEQTAQPVVRFAFVVGRALQAQAVIACANTVLTMIGLFVLKIPSMAMLSLIVFFCSFIPALGVFLSTTPMVLLALNNNGPGTAMLVIVFVCGVHAIEAYVLNPLIYGKHLKLNPVIVLMILFIGNHAFGIWGMLLGVPVTFYLLHDVFGVPVIGERISGAGRALASLPRSSDPFRDLAPEEDLGAKIEDLKDVAER